LARLAFSLLIIPLLPLSCSYKNPPTYLKQDLERNIKRLAKSEYGIDITVLVKENNIWVYLPVKDILIKSTNPKKDTKKAVTSGLTVESCKTNIENGAIEVEYLINAKPEDKPETENQYENLEYNKEVGKKVNNILKVLQRVLFSIEEPESFNHTFLNLIIADIKSGIVVKQILYYMDLKKFFYGRISAEELQERIIQRVSIVNEIIDDKSGVTILSKAENIKMKDFIAAQIKQRIELKFAKLTGKEQEINTDEQVRNIVIAAIKNYEFYDFTEIKLRNNLTEGFIYINKAAALETPDN